MKVLLKFIFAVTGIILVSGLPLLIRNLLDGHLSVPSYFQGIFNTLKSLWPLNEIAVENFHIGMKVPVFPRILDSMLYSLEILFLALASAVATALLFTVITMLLSDKARERIKMALYFLESLPDLLVIMLVQLGIVFIYKNTGVLLSSVAVLGDNKIYFLPVLCLMILPAIQLYRLCVLTFEEEERQMYVDLARSLGFSKSYIILVHMFRNAVISVFFQSKKTMWFMLSNLFILELMFNIPGVMLFMEENMTPQIFLLTVFSFFLPMFVLYSVGEWFFVRRLRGKEAL